jgi:parvulin-like peptidyl-prolyl isomerase
MITPKFALFYVLLSAFSAHGFSRAFATPVLVDRLEAIVNKKAIYLSDVEKFRHLMPLRAKVDPLFNNNPIAREAHPDDAAIVSFLVDEELINQKFPVADADVEQEINGIQTNLKIDRAGLKEAITREGFKFEEYFQLMRTSIAKRQLIDREIRSKAAVSDDDLKSEYNREQSGAKNFKGLFHLSLMKFTKANFKSPKLAKEQAEKALDEVTKGEEFRDVAKKESDDMSAPNGGDMGYLSYDDMSENLQQNVRNLPPGKTSAVIDDGKTYLIVKVEDIKADTDTGFEKDKDQIRGRLMEGEFAHQVRLWLDRERSLAFVKINTATPPPAKI